MAMSKKERVRAALAGEHIDHPPVSLWGHDFLREWSAQDLVANTLEAFRPYDWDFIKFNPRATYFAEAWGNTYDRPVEQRQPRPLSHVISAADDLRRLEPVAANEGVFAEHLASLRMLVEAAGPAIDVLHTVFSPLSVTAMLCGSPAEFKAIASGDPEAVHGALRAVTATLSAYARASIDAGATGIFYAPLIWASRDTASEEFYMTFGRPYDLEILDAVSGAEFNVFHVCRNNNMIRALLDYPVAAFNWADRGEGNPSLTQIRAETGKAVMGGIDHAALHTMTAADVSSQARDAMAAGPERLFVTGGCAIPPQTPDANRHALAEAVRGGA